MWYTIQNITVDDRDPPVYKKTKKNLIYEGKMFLEKYLPRKHKTLEIKGDGECLKKKTDSNCGRMQMLERGGGWVKTDLCGSPHTVKNSTYIHGYRLNRACIPK